MKEPATSGGMVSQASRDGEFLVLPIDRPVGPGRCIFSNQQISERTKIRRRLSCGSQGDGDFLPMWLKVLFAAKNMRFVTVELGVSGKEQAKRRLLMVASLGLALFGLYLLVSGIAKGEIPPPMITTGGGAALFIVSAVIFSNAFSFVYIVKMNDRFVWLRGAGKPFLNSLPPHRG